MTDDWQATAQTLSFYISKPRPCPYLKGQSETRLLTHLPYNKGREVYDLLSQHGFRRSQNIVYRPHCPQCNACKSVRIRVADLQITKSFARILKRNEDVTVCRVPPEATQEQFSLFHRYVTSRHAGGGMAEMTALDYAAMIEETSIDTYLVEYRIAEQLVGVMLIDDLRDGPSLVYSFFDIDMPRRSLGTFMVLDAVLTARSQQLPYVYLGYWVENSPVMGYKAKFQPLEIIQKI